MYTAILQRLLVYLAGNLTLKALRSFASCADRWRRMFWGDRLALARTEELYSSQMCLFQPSSCFNV